MFYSCQFLAPVFFVPEKWRYHQQVSVAKKLAPETCRSERGLTQHRV